MLLAEGISGFTNIKFIHKPGETPRLTMDQQVFMKACYNIQNMRRTKIIKFDFALVGKNFYIAETQFGDQILYILLNAFYPYIAFSTSGDKCNLKFIDDIDLENKFINLYRVLKASELISELSSEEMSSLNEQELKEIKYYEPRNIGEVIFNCWS